MRAAGQVVNDVLVTDTFGSLEPVLSETNDVPMLWRLNLESLLLNMAFAMVDN